MRLLFTVFALLAILVFSATMDVLDGSAQLNIVWSEKKKLMAQGHDPVRADQLVFRLPEAPMSKFFLDDLWFDIVTWMGAEESDAPLRKRYKGHQWIWNFMPSTNPVSAEGLPPDPFLDARSEFELHPNRCIETLEAFSHDLCVQDISIALIKFFVHSAKQRDFLSCWIEIQNRIISIASPSPAGVHSKAIDPLQTDLDAAHDFLTSPEVGGGVKTKGLNDVTQFIDNLLQNWCSPLGVPHRAG